MATDITGRLSQWLIVQNPKWSSTPYVWNISIQSKSPWRRKPLAIVIGLVINFGLLVLTFAMGDWFGVANTFAMIVSVIVRSFLTHENRLYIDRTISYMQGGERDVVKVFCTLPDGKADTLSAPRGIVIHTFLTTPRPARPKLYGAIRALGWLGPACHVVGIGQAILLFSLKY